LTDLFSGHDHNTFTVLHPKTGVEETISFSGTGLQRLKFGLVKAGLDPQFFEWPPNNDPDRSPYRGMLPLEGNDAGIFFGREAPTIELLSKIRGLREENAQGLMVILGASGAGKSSFLRAGLLPRLQRDERHFITLPIVRPERGVLWGDNGLLKALVSAFKLHQIPFRQSILDTAIKAESDELANALQTLSEKSMLPSLEGETSSKRPTIILSVDQGEELFHAETQQESNNFLQLLEKLLSSKKLSIIVLFTIRSDSYENLQIAKPLEGITQNTFSLGPMPHGSYQGVIEKPAERLKDTHNELKIQASLTQTLLEDLERGGRKDSLPLLAFTMECLYLEYGGDGDLTLKEYNQLGGIEGAIDVAVEKALQLAIEDEKLPNDRKEITSLLRRGFIPWLAGIDSESQQPHRRVAKFHEIPVEAQPIINYLVQCRLLATDVDVDSNEVTIEPAHEALLRQWGLLKGWLQEDFASLTILESVQRASRDWEANLQVEDWLNHSAGRLEDAESIKGNENLAQFFNPSDWKYLESCREKQDRQRNKELEDAKKLAASEKKAVQERNSALSTQNDFLMDLVKQENNKDNYDVAMMLGLNAVPGLYGGERPEPSSMAQLYHAVSNNRKLLELQNSSNTDCISFTPDGSKIITTTTDQQIIVWCSLTAKKLLCFDIDFQPHHIVIAPDGQHVLTLQDFMAERKYPALWSLETEEKIHEYAVKCINLNTIFNSSSTKMLIGNRLAYYHNDGELIKHTDLIRQPQYSADLEKYLACPKENKFQLNLFSVERGFQKSYTFSEKVVYAAFIPLGKHFIVISNLTSPPSQGIVRVYSSDTIEPLQEFKVEGEFEKENISGCKQIVFNPNGLSFIVLSHTKSTLWIESKIETDNGMLADYNYLFNDSGSLLAMYSDDGQIIIRDGLTYRFLLSFNLDKKIDHLIFSPCSGYIVSYSFSDGNTQLWEINTMEGIHRLSYQQDKGRVIFSPTGQHFLSISEDKDISLFQLQRLDKQTITDQKISNIINPNYSPIESNVHIQQIKSLRQQFHNLWSNLINAVDDKLLSVVCSKRLSIWSIEEEIELARNESIQVDSIIGFSPDGQALVAQQNHTIFFIYSVTMEVLWKFHGQKFAKTSKDNQLLAIVSMGREAIIISMNSGEAIFSLEHQKTISDICFTDEFIITTSESDHVIVWAISNGQELYSLDVAGVITLSLSPDDAWLLCKTKDKCYLYSTKHWKLEYEITGSFALSANALPIFTNDNHVLLIEDRSVSLCSTTTGKTVNEYTNKDKCYHCAIAPTNQILAIASENNHTHQVSLWHIDTGEILTTYQYLTRVDTVYFSNDSKSLLVTLQNGSTDYLEVYFDNVVNMAYQRLPINRKVLTPEERDTYFLPKLTNEQWLKLGYPQYVN
jgi:WD40 repeat protein